MSKFNKKILKTENQTCRKVVPFENQQCKKQPTNQLNQGQQRFKKHYQQQFIQDPNQINSIISNKFLKNHEISTTSNIKQYKIKQDQINTKIEIAKQKKLKILTQNFPKQHKYLILQHDIQNNLIQYKIQKEETFQLRQQFYHILNELKNINEKISILKQQLFKLEQLSSLNNKTKIGNTRENIFEKLHRLEQKLLIANLTMREEKVLQNQISTIKRSINSIVFPQNLENQLKNLSQVKLLKEQIEYLKSQKKQYQVQLDKIKLLLDSQNTKLTKLKQTIKKLQQKRSIEKVEYIKQKQQFYQERNKKEQEINEKIEKLQKKKKLLMKQYHQENNQYTKQQTFKQSSTDGSILQNTKQNQIISQFLPNKNYQLQITNCSFLINYFSKWKFEEFNKIQSKLQKIDAEQLSMKMSSDNQWKREKGIIIVKSKKDNNDLDIEVSKKNKKRKKYEVNNQKNNKQQKTKKQKLYLDLQIMKAFDSIKMLPPEDLSQIDNVLKFLRQKLNLYLQLSNEYKLFDEKSINQQIAYKKSQSHKIEIKQEEFIEL